MKSTKERNSSIDIFRYICAILVVAIHTSPLNDIDPSLGFIATDVIPRIGVPFFFIVSGFFYIQKLQSGDKPFRHYLMHLVLIYSVWSCLYFIIQFAEWGYTNIKGFTINCIVTYFYYGSFYHFWYFPALIFALCLTTFIWRLGGKRIILPLSICFYIIGVLGCAYYNLCRDVPFLGAIITHSQFNNIRRILLMGFPFFVGGHLVIIIKDKFNKWQAFLMWVASLLTWIAEIVIVVNLQFHQNIVITFGLYMFVVSTMVVLVQNPLLCLNSTAKTFRKMANLTYYTHPAFILLLKFVINKTSGQCSLSNTPMFLLTVLITLIVGLFISRLDNPLINKLIG